MTIANMNDPNTITGAPVRGSDGEKLGKVDAIYFDDDTDQPEWAAVKSGLFGSHVSLVPLAQASWRRRRLHRALRQGSASRPRRTTTRTPRLSPADEDELYRHYGLTRRPHRPRDGRRDRVDEPGTVGHDTSGPTTDDAMTRSEEQLRVGHRDPRGRPGPAAQARRHRAPAGHGAGLARRGHPRARADHRRQPRRRLRRPGHLRGGARGHAARASAPSSSTEAVAVERVQLGKETVTEQETVGGEVRKEQIELDNSDVTNSADTTATGERRKNRN